MGLNRLLLAIESKLAHLLLRNRVIFLSLLHLCILKLAMRLGNLVPLQHLHILGLLVS